MPKTKVKLHDIIKEERPKDFFKFSKGYTDGAGRYFKETLLPDYYATRDGQVARIIFDEGTMVPNKFSIIKEEIDKYGAVRISDSSKKHYPLSRMVYSAYGPEPLNPTYQIAHKDLDSKNNSADNLIQFSKEDNIQFQKDNGVYGKNSTKACKVLNKSTGEILEYDSVKDFLIDVGAPEYIVKRIDTSSLLKLNKFKHLEMIRD